MNEQDRHLLGKYARNRLIQWKIIPVTKVKTVFQERSVLNLCIANASVLLEVPFMVLKQRYAFVG